MVFPTAAMTRRSGASARSRVTASDRLSALRAAPAALKQITTGSLSCGRRHARGQKRAR
jgi:hypothetical protein